MAFNNSRIPSFSSHDSGYGSEIVEVFDEPRPVIKNLDHAKEAARQVQHRMASELSRRDADEYQQDMLEHMLKIDVSADLGSCPQPRSQLTIPCNTGRDRPRCRCHRHSDRDTMVHETVPPRLLV
jgi:hypothetical protein